MNSNQVIIVALLAFAPLGGIATATALDGDETQAFQPVPLMAESSYTYDVQVSVDRLATDAEAEAMAIAVKESRRVSSDKTDETSSTGARSDLGVPMTARGPDGAVKNVRYTEPDPWRVERVEHSPSALEVHIKPVEDYWAEDGNEHLIFGVAATRPTAPWDARGVHLVEDAEHLSSIERTLTTYSKHDAMDASLVERWGRTYEMQWYDEDADNRFHFLQSEGRDMGEVVAGQRAGTLDGLFALLAQGNGQIQVREGTYEGKAVYGVVVHDQRDHELNALTFGCSPLAPTYPHEEPLPARMFEETVRERVEQRLWFDAETSLPVHASCAISLDLDGVEIGRVEVRMALSDLHQGHPAIDVTWGPLEPLAAKPLASAVPSQAHSWPIHSDSPFAFPLAEAYATMLADDRLATFFADAAPHAYLVDAYYAPMIPLDVCDDPTLGTLPDCPRDAAPPEADAVAPEPQQGQLWRFALVNPAGDAKVVFVTRTVTMGEPTATEVWFTPMNLDIYLPEQPEHDDFHGAMMPLVDARDAWVARSGIDWNVWAETPGSSFHIHTDAPAYHAGGMLDLRYMVVLGPIQGDDAPPVEPPANAATPTTVNPPPTYPGDQTTCVVYEDPEQQGTSGVPDVPGARQALAMGDPFGAITGLDAGHGHDAADHDAAPVAPRHADRSARNDAGPAPWFVCWQDVIVFSGEDGRFLQQRSDLYEACDDENGPEMPMSIEPMGSAPTIIENRPLAGYLVAGSMVGLAGVLVGLRALRERLPAFLFLPLYAKLSKDRLLKHSTRDEILMYVRANPGALTEEIRQHAGIGWGTVVYHLSALEHHTQLTSRKVGRHRSWFVPGAASPQEKGALALLRSAAARRLFELVERQPGLTQQDAAAELGVTHGAVIFQANRLQQMGLLRKERDGRHVRYFPGPTVEGDSMGQAMQDAVSHAHPAPGAGPS